MSARVFVPVPVTWRCLSSDSVKRNHQSTRDRVSKCKKLQGISTSTPAIYLECFSSVVTLPKEAGSTASLCLSTSLWTHWFINTTEEQRKEIFPFVPCILAVTFISRFLEPLLSALSQLLINHY